MYDVTIKRVAVFCGANYGYETIYRDTAFQVGKELAKEGIEVVFGGAEVGLMGRVADGVLSEGGTIIAVTPEQLGLLPIGHKGVKEVILTKTITERKEVMEKMCDGFITLPGGFGSLDELFNVLTKAQLNQHEKPIGLLNINGFYDDLIQLVKKMERLGFIRSITRGILLHSEDINTLLTQMRYYHNPGMKKLFHKDIL